MVDKKIRKEISETDEEFASNSLSMLEGCQVKRTQKQTVKVVTPLYLACKNDHIDGVEYLLSCLEIDINAGAISYSNDISVFRRCSPLELVCKKANHRLIKLLSLHGASTHNIKNLDLILERTEIPK